MFWGAKRAMKREMAEVRAGIVRDADLWCDLFKEVIWSVCDDPGTEDAGVKKVRIAAAMADAALEEYKVRWK